METPKFAKKEKLEIKAEILSFENLIDEIYKGQNLPQDERFLADNKGGVFKFFEPKNLTDSDYRERGNKIFPVIRLGDEIVALSELEKDSYKDNNFWIKFISVDPKYQNSGYATQLVEKIFQFAKENNYSLETSIYSDEGLDKLKKIIKRFEEETGVQVINRSKF